MRVTTPELGITAFQSVYLVNFYDGGTGIKRQKEKLVDVFASLRGELGHP